MRTTIVKWGNSQGVRLPKSLLDNVNLSNSDLVDLIEENGNIVIKKVVDKKPYQTIQERFKDFEDEYQPVSIDWDIPVGKEIW
ncbi:MAG: AbrB/MazE/SpoVT family DNA-binding domain-containing protein [Syntrophomonadaceae bacterium]|jgi:antitoxin MazE|nr:AbrB/MazE/SpoVT family DNA-binding domain-containing protein [Syntrophomonadaceae bacterium]